MLFVLHYTFWPEERTKILLRGVVLLYTEGRKQVPVITYFYVYSYLTMPNLIITRIQVNSLLIE